MNRRLLDLWMGILLVLPVYLEIQGVHLALFQGGVASTGREASEQILPLSFFISPIAIYLAGKSSLRLIPSAFTVLLGGLATWFGLLSVTSSLEVGSASPILRMFQWLVPFAFLYYGASLIADPGRLVAFLRGIVFGVAGTLFWVGTSLGIENRFTTLFTRMGDTAWGIGLYQPYSYVPLGVALLLLMVTPLLFTSSGFLVFPKLKAEPIRLVLFLLLFGAMALFTLAAAVGDVVVVLSVGGAVIFVLFRRSFTISQRVLVIGVIAVGAIVVAALADQGLPLLEKVNYVLVSEDKSRDRSWIFAQAIKLSLESPIVGTRFMEPEGLPSAHNYYLDAWLWTGAPGLLLILAMVTVFVKDIFKGFRTQAFAVARQGGTLAFQLFLGSAVGGLLMLLWSNNLNVPMRQPYSGDIGWLLVGFALALAHRFEQKSQPV